METKDIEMKADISHIEQHLDSKEQDHTFKGDDDAIKVLKLADRIEFSVDEDKRVLRMIDFWVLTPMVIVYTLQQIDKSSLGYSAVFNLQAEAHLVGAEYSSLTSALYATEFLFQMSSAVALVKFSVKKWLLFNVFAWGVVTACTGASTNFTGLVTCRIFLGVFEATVGPTFIAITQMWWRRREQSFRTIMWQISNSIAAIVGPLIAYGVGHINSGIQPYQGIFIFLGCITVAFTPLVAYLLPESPSQAKFLKNGDDRYVAIERLRSNNTGIRSYTWKWNQCWEALRDPKVWCWAMMSLMLAAPSGGFSSFGGLITKGFGFSAFNTILFQIPIGVFQIALLLSGIWAINKFKLRFPIIAFLALFPIGGAVGIYFVPRTNLGGLLICYYIAQLLGVLNPLFIAWATLNQAGHTKKVVTTALFYCTASAGNIIGPQVFLAKEAPYYHTGLKVSIACWSMMFVLVIAQGFYLMYLNKQQEKRRVAAGRPRNVLDTSIMTLEEAAAYTEQLLGILRAEGSHSELNVESFDDLTDWENMDFQYVI